MLAPVVVCIGCGTPTKEAVNGRCPVCAPAHERERSTTRMHFQPWVRLYKLTRWRKTRLAAIARDRGRCSLRLSSRCLGSVKLIGHHKPASVEQLWLEANGDWDRFVELACDVDAVVTACQVCHNEDDAAMRVSRLHVKGGRGSADARPVGSRRGLFSGPTSTRRFVAGRDEA
jgi:5-methylcytosine-specific restriction endonuclease McrA